MGPETCPQQKISIRIFEQQYFSFVSVIMKHFFIILFLFISNALIGQSVNSEYADKVVGTYYSKANISFSELYGGEGFNFPVLINPHWIEGDNQSYFVSLPTGSYIIMQFTNNMIVDYPGQDDIFITENGCNNEKAEVFVSTDGKNFTRLGIVDDCYESSLDLADIGFKSPVKYVKVVGLDMNGGSPGFDLVNIKGLPKSSVDINTDAIADSLDNLADFGFETSNVQIPSGFEWVLESDQLPDAQISLYGPDKDFIPINYKSVQINKVVIDASGFQKGIYTLQIVINKKVITQKINIG